MNVLRSGHAITALIALLLDVSKGVVPVVVAAQVPTWRGWPLALIAVLAVAGNAFSPFLRFRGGKSLAVTLGTWIGLTLWQIPLIAVTVVVVADLLVQPDGWAVLVALAAMGLGVSFWLRDPALGVALLGQSAIILSKHRSDLAQRPRWRRRTGAPRR
jgi:glycerol-3-phosphate acyltransferase PlsY